MAIALGLLRLYARLTGPVGTTVLCLFFKITTTALACLSLCSSSMRSEFIGYSIVAVWGFSLNLVMPEFWYESVSASKRVVFARLVCSSRIVKHSILGFLN
jgi:hypothetical protein